VVSTDYFTFLLERVWQVGVEGDLIKPAVRERQRCEQGLVWGWLDSEGGGYWEGMSQGRYAEVGVKLDCL
jgi:hypothetical protein